MGMVTPCHNDSANLLLFCMINVMCLIFPLCHNESAEIAARIKLSHDDLAKLSYKIWKSPGEYMVNIVNTHHRIV